MQVVVVSPNRNAEPVPKKHLADKIITHLNYMIIFYLGTKGSQKRSHLCKCGNYYSSVFATLFFEEIVHLVEEGIFPAF